MRKMNFKKRFPLRIGAQAAAIFRVLFLHRPLRRAPPRPRLVASGRTRFVSRSCTRATLFPSSRPATRHAHPLEKAELVKSMLAASARGPRLPRAVARRAPLLEARDRRRASRCAHARAPGSIQHRGRYARRGRLARLAAPRSISASPFQTAAERDGSRRANSPRFQTVLPFKSPRRDGSPRTRAARESTPDSRRSRIPHTGRAARPHAALH